MTGHGLITAASEPCFSVIVPHDPALGFGLGALAASEAFAFGP